MAHVARRAGRAFLAVILGVAALHAEAACTVVASSMGFGVIQAIPGSSWQRDSVASVTVSCIGLTTNTSYSIAIGPSSGQTSSAARYMRSALGGTPLIYNLYVDPARTQVWGDASGSMVTGVIAPTGLLTGEAQHTIYGKITGGQSDVQAGTFSDTVRVTVSYNP